MKSVKRRIDEKAFSLIEVAIALAVFCVAIIGLIGLIPMAILAHKQAIDNTIIAQINKQLSGEVEMCGPLEFQNYNNQTWYYDYQGNQLTNAQASGIVYRAETQVTNVTLPGQTSASNSLQLVQIYSADDPAGTVIGGLVSKGTPSRVIVVNQPAALVTTGL